ncbi:Aldehyde dehydrogenase, cytosolic 1 [Fusarium oxysporum f. sp. conglutinans]|nr:Aldehyde dehydrogenase, cytosolic 1 [Fusarium oxysporum f. sp. conglutinans]
MVKYVGSLEQPAKEWKLVSPVDDSVVVNDAILAGKADVDRVVAASEEAFRQGPWSTFSGIQRAACLNKFAALVEKNAEYLAYVESLPTGRPVGFIQDRDLTHMVQVFRYYAGWADKIAGQSFTEEQGSAKIVRYKPLGVCASIVSWNGTFMYVGWKVAPALAAGNTAKMPLFQVIFKPSEKSPLGALALGPLFAEAGFPPGVVQFLPGARETGSLLASHMRISKISFTGSVAGGKAVQEAATRSNLKRVTLELGGKSAAIVFSDADFATAVRGVAEGFLENSGQICVAASRLLVEESIADKFIDAVRAVFETATAELGGNPLEKSTRHGPVVDQIQFDHIMSYIETGKASAQLLTGGKRKGTKGCFIEPTIFVHPTDDSPVWKEEIFGPVLTIKTFKDEQEAIFLANDTAYGLAACVYTKDLTRALRVSMALESGGVQINSPFTPQLNTPFGGVKQSGQGRELGIYGLYSYLELQSIHI